MLKYLLFVPQITPLVILLYFLPGFLLSRLLSGRWRNQPFIWIFLSLIFNGPLYSFLVLINKLTLSWWLFSEAAIFLIVYLFFRYFHPPALTLTVPEDGPAGNHRSKYILLMPLILFFILIGLTKGDIFMKRLPIVADDYWHLGKVVSVATSTSIPQHFQYPLANLSYYYFSYVSPGLLTRFSNNLSEVQRSFSIDFVLRLSVYLYFIWLMAMMLFKRLRSRLAFVLALTFFGGWEFWVGFLAGAKALFDTHLEYWPGLSALQTLPQLSGFTTLNIWVPQHLFAALSLFFVYLILFKAVGGPLIKYFYISLTLAGALGFSLFSGFPVFATTLTYLIFESISSRNFIRLLKIPLLVMSIAVLLLPFITQIGLRRSSFYPSLSRLDFLNENYPLIILANFIMTIPVYYFLGLGLLFVGLVYAVFLLIRHTRSLNREQLFWIIALVPLLAVLLVKFQGSNDYDFTIRSRSIIPSLLALAVFTGYAIDKIKGRKLASALIIFYFFTTPTVISEIKQNLKVTPRTYTFYTELDQRLPLNSVLFTQKDAVGHYWLLPLFVHRMVVKPNGDFEMIDRQYTGYDPYPVDGLPNDDSTAIPVFLLQHPELRKKYQLFYLTKEALDLPVEAQDLDYRLYRLNK